VHAFATDPARGIFILVFLALVIGGSLLLFALRAPRVGMGGAFDTVSRESMLLLNNVVFVVAAASVLLGTLYPLALDALGMGKISVGAPYFETVFVPLMVPALFLMGVGPLARWKSAPLPELAVRLRWAAAVSVLVALGLPAVLGRWSWGVSGGLLLATWITATTLSGVAHRVRSSAAVTVLAKLASPSRSYYGMVAAHLGIAVFVVGVTLVKGYGTEKDLRMEPGDTTELAGYVFRFGGVRDVEGPNYVAARGTIEITRNGKPEAVLYPEKRVYTVQQNPMTEAAIDTGFTRDLYVALGDAVSATAWVVRVQHKPFVTWIWGGCLVMALGGALAISDRRYRIASRPVAVQPALHDGAAPAPAK
jgi:cytochrome c-type biogenesis protein CcmF